QMHDWRNPADLQHLVAIAGGLSMFVIWVASFFVLEHIVEDDDAGERRAAVRRWLRVAGTAGIFLVVLGVLRYFSPGFVPGISPMFTSLRSQYMRDWIRDLGFTSDPPRSYLMPTGFTLLAAGTVFVAISLGFCSENRLVVLTRREFTTFFVSPVA